MDIVLDNIYKGYGDVKVLEGFSHIFKDAAVTCITGPSGCGKSTLLDIVAGLTVPDSGTVQGLDGRRMAYVFQEPLLLPWKTVLENVELAVPEGIPPGQRRSGAMDALSVVGLEDAAGLYPEQLSGGMAQRASIARALAADTSVMLLDEPFSALDESLRLETMTRLKEIFNRRRMTVLLVTHSSQEVAFWGNNLCLFEK